MGFAIFNGKRQYVPRVWRHRREAEKELRDMLRIYPKDDPWHARLSVQEVKASEKTRQEAA